jgi:hypothetical protein
MGQDGPPTPPPDDRPERPPEEGERFGPLRLQRITKDDGRLLILYSREEEAEERER